MNKQIEEVMERIEAVDPDEDSLILWVNPFEKGHATRFCVIGDLKALVSELRAAREALANSSPTISDPFPFDLDCD